MSSGASSFWAQVVPFSNVPPWRWAGGALVFAAFLAYALWREKKARAAKAALKHATTRAK